MSDFRRIADIALARAELLVSRWLPDGRRAGAEWVALNPTRADGARGSFSVNVATGRWSDFATGDKGGDLVSLCAYLFHGGDQVAALRDLAEELGEALTPPPGRQGTQGNEPPETPACPPPKVKGSPWVPIVPVPANAPPRPVAHPFRGRPDQVWEYRSASGVLLGIVCRFTTSDGGKEVLPCVFAEHAETHARDWRWMSFRKPRPLYGLDSLAQAGDVLVVEGEKCADAARAELGDRYAVLTWPGGSKAVGLADWAVLRGRRVVIWPDCDAQTDKTGDIKGEAEQPGMRAAMEVARIIGGLGCEVYRVRIPAPGAKPHGWDVADAIAEGLRGEALADWIAERLEPVAAPRAVAAASKLPADDSSWRQGLIMKPRGGIEECRENVYLFLANHPSLQGRVAINEFQNAVVKVGELPWASYDAEWQEIDDLRLGYWLANTNGLLMKNSGAIRDGVTLAAFEQRIHPVRDWLGGLQWDGVARLDHWLEECLGAAGGTYYKLAGRFFLVSMVARIMQPGCKVDALLVLESDQGAGKSSALRIIAGEHFSDTPFVMGDKDSFMALRGRWLYEIAELDSLNKADITRAKAFLSSQVDSYRAPYEARYENHPRQCVFAATTNQYEYLKDLTGNRRFWPVRCGVIDLDKLAQWREQLFAEALAVYKEGAKWYPDDNDFRDHFAPEIERRLLDDPWETLIAEWVDHPDVAWMLMPGKGVTVAEVLRSAIKMDASKIGGARVEASRVGTIMKRLGYTRWRRATGRREWVYVMDVCEPQTAWERTGAPDLPI